MYDRIQIMMSTVMNQATHPCLKVNKATPAWLA